jgi:hypothetical protein
MVEPLLTPITYAIMRMRWKLLGLAGVAGVAASGVVVARKRAHRDYDPAELRDRLHQRLAEIRHDNGASGSAHLEEQRET